MASSSGNNLEAENRQLKKELEVMEKLYANLLDDFKQLKTHSLLLEEDIELLRKPQEPWRPTPKPKGEDDYFSSYFGKGPIKFGRCDVHGHFLELENQSNIVKKIGGFIIKRIVGELIIEVALPESARIQPQSKLVIYASNSNSETPILNSQTIVLDNVGHWLSGDLMQTTLLDKNGKEIASIVQKELDYA